MSALAGAKQERNLPSQFRARKSPDHSIRCRSYRDPNLSGLAHQGLCLTSRCHSTRKTSPHGLALNFNTEHHTNMRIRVKQKISPIPAR
jgi:hypothetical protein